MKPIDIVKKGLRYGEPVIAALETIQQITGIGGRDTANALKTIDAVVKATLAGIANGTPPEDLIKELAKYTDAVEASDIKFDNALAEKFKDKEKP